MATSAGGKAEQAGDSASLEGLARVGLIAYGVVHLLVGWLALQLAWGASASKSADPSGALRTLADQPFGKILLWLVALGLVALALWQASEVIWGDRSARRGPARPGPRATPPPPARLAPQPPAPWRRPHGKAGDPLTLDLVGEVGHPPRGCLVSSRLR
jgi:Domain of Unknown Function (DUF1206)